MLNLAKLQRDLGYEFDDQLLLSQALTHRSFGSKNNERLEFLGDSIVNFVIGEALYRRFDTANEGQLSRLRAKMVRQSTLAEVARDLALGDHLIMGIGELKSGGFERDSILSDALEAIIGAIYLDANLGRVQQQILRWFESRIELLSLNKPLKDAKSRLQEYMQERQIELPIYDVKNDDSAKSSSSKPSVETDVNADEEEMDDVSPFYKPKDEETIECMIEDLDGKDYLVIGTKIYHPPRGFDPTTETNLNETKLDLAGIRKNTTGEIQWLDQDD